MHPASLNIELLLNQCQVKTTRRGGPGGQHRNKTDTAVVITHESGIFAQAGESRSQDTNRKNAVHRLRLKLATQLRTPCSDTLSETWMQRCVQQPLVISSTHKDLPAILAEAMNHLAEANYDLASTSQRLSTTSSQILKLLKKHPPALHNCNRQRAEKGLHPLV